LAKTRMWLLIENPVAQRRQLFTKHRFFLFYYN